MNLPSILIIIAVGFGLFLAVRHLVAGRGRYGCGHRCGECPSASQCTEVGASAHKKKRNTDKK